MSDRVPVTRFGALSLKAELKRLKSVERPKNIEALELARAHGDLKENADYDAAKNRQAFIEASIRNIEGKLALAEVIDISKFTGDKVKFGATVTLAGEHDAKVVYKIVGDIEADIKKGKISVISPISRALIGREVGDSVVVRGPKGGESEYEILSVQFIEEAFVEE